MNSKKKPVGKSKSTKPEKSLAKVARPVPEHTAKGDKKSSERGNASASARLASHQPPLKSNPAPVEYYQDIIATIRDPLVVLDTDLRVLSANRSFYRLFKVKQKETVGNLVYDLGNRQWDIPTLRTLLETILPEKAVFNDYEVEHEFPTIGRRTMLLNARRIPAPPKEAQWILLAFEDVTDRKQAKRELRESEERFRSILDNIEDGYYEVDTAGNLTFFNPALVRMLGRPAHELTGMNNRVYMTPEGAKTVFQTFNRVFRTVIPEQATDWELVRPDGTRRSVEASVSPIKAANGSINGFRGIVRDITVRKQMEEKSEEERILLRTLIDNLPDRVYVMDVLGQKIISNIADWQACGGKAMEDVIGKTDLDIYPPELAESYWAHDKSVIDSGESILNLEEPGLDSQGKRVSLLSSKVPLRDVQGNVIGLVGIGRDISERKQAEETLRESEEKWRSLFGILPVGVSIVSSEHLVMDTNPALSQILELSKEDLLNGKFKGRKYLRADKTLMPPQEFPSNRAVKEQKIIRNVEIGVEKEDGTLIWTSVSATPLPSESGSVTVTVDITERKQAEQEIRQLNAKLEQRVEERTRELRQAQEKLIRQEKLAVLGQLAGGVGHELRNPLGVINTSIYYLKLVQPEAGGKIKRHHDMIEQEVHNAEKIIADLLDFARVISADREPASVPELVRGVLARYPVPSAVKVALKLPANLPKVFADPRQMEQVLGNFTTNACQAMMPQGGKLTISAFRKKELVAIAVKDTGTGITPENMKKLFEPLFTTKVKGIGLGLVVSRKLAEANGGRIEVESQPGKGSTFTLVLPVST